MDIKGAIQKHFVEAIRNAPVDPELKRSAQHNHRFKAFQSKLYQEILSVELLRRKQSKPPLRPQTVRDIVYSFVSTYLTGIQNEAMRRAESDIARLTREAEAQKRRDLEASSTGPKLSGDYAELQEGLVLQTDERDVSL